MVYGYYTQRKSFLLPFSSVKFAKTAITLFCSSPKSHISSNLHNLEAALLWTFSEAAYIGFVKKKNLPVIFAKRIPRRKSFLRGTFMKVFL